MKKRLRVNYDGIQKAMEDVRRDRFDYFLDLKTGDTITLPISILNEALRVLYGSPSPEYDRDVLFDSEVNLEAELSERHEETVELALSVLMDEARYIRIPERSSVEAFQVMRAFTGTVSDPVLRRRLTEALDGAGAFRRFKDTLLSDRKERKRWHGYNAKAMRRVIDEWLRAGGII